MSKYEHLKRIRYSVFEKEPAHQGKKNGVILGPYNSISEAEEARVRYGYGNDNYYVDVDNEYEKYIIYLEEKAMEAKPSVCPTCGSNKLYVSVTGKLCCTRCVFG